MGAGVREPLQHCILTQGDAVVVNVHVRTITHPQGDGPSMIRWLWKFGQVVRRQRGPCLKAGLCAGRGLTIATHTKGLQERRQPEMLMNHGLTRKQELCLSVGWGGEWEVRESQVFCYFQRSVTQVL